MNCKHCGKPSNGSITYLGHTFCSFACRVDWNGARLAAQRGKICPMCEKPTPRGNRFCSPACRENFVRGQG